MQRHVLGTYVRSEKAVSWSSPKYEVQVNQLSRAAC